MPAPIVPLLIGAAGGAVGSSVVGAVASPITRRVNQLANIASPIEIPAPGELLDSYIRGYISQSNLRSALLGHGIDFPAGNPAAGLQSFWLSVADAKQWRPDFSTVISLLDQGIIDDQAARLYARRVGVLGDNHYSQALRLENTLSTSEVLNLRRQGVIDEFEYRRLMNISRIRSDGNRRNVEMLTQPLTNLDVMSAYFRRVIDEETRDRWMILAGLTNGEQRRVAQKIMEQIPGPSDLVRFAVRDVWNRAVVERFGYDDEYDNIPEFRYWMESQGYVGSAIRPGGQPGGPQTWDQAYWWAHWQLPSPTQAYEMFYRLRPEKMAEYRAVFPTIQPFVLEDLQTLLKTADYPPSFRDRLAAISYRLPGRIDIRKMYEQGLTTAEQVNGQYLDLGYSPTNARLLTRFTIDGREATWRKAVRDKAIKGTVTAYSLGGLSREQAIANLIGTGLSQQTAIGLIDGATLDRDLSAARSAIRAIRSGYIRWEYGRDAASARLFRIGVVQEAIDSYLLRWDSEREAKGRRASASQVLKFVVRGLMSQSEAYARLLSMGYDGPDATRMIRIAVEDYLLKQSQLQKQAATAEKDRQKAIENEIKSLQRQSANLVKALSKGGTLANFRKWYAMGIMDKEEIAERLLTQGWAPGDVDSLIRELEKGPQPKEDTEDESTEEG